MATRPASRSRRNGGVFHGLQLWVNLPRSKKMNPPRYQDLRAQGVALLTSDDGGALLRVIAGELGGHAGPGSTYTPMTLVHATLSPGATLVLPWREDYNALASKLSPAGLPKNFSLSHKDPIFLDLVSQSEYLIGAFSTTLFEGLALGCKVLVLPLSGYQNVLPAIASGDLTLISNLEELPTYLAKAKVAADPHRYYAAS